MKAPDVIFLNCRPQDDDFDYALWSKAPFTDDSIHEEYIRKDALLEWAEGFKKTPLPGKTVIAYLIEKIESL